MYSLEFRLSFLAPYEPSDLGNTALGIKAFRAEYSVLRGMTGFNNERVESFL